MLAITTAEQYGLAVSKQAGDRVIIISFHFHSRTVDREMVSIFKNYPIILCLPAGKSRIMQCRRGYFLFINCLLHIGHWILSIV